MKVARLAAIVVLLVFSVGFAGCGGGGEKMKSSLTTTSLGQELSDLEKAYSQGIITDKEYDKAKKGLVKRFK